MESLSHESARLVKLRALANLWSQGWGQGKPKSEKNDTFWTCDGLCTFSSCFNGFQPWISPYWNIEFGHSDAEARDGMSPLIHSLKDVAISTADSTSSSKCDTNAIARSSTCVPSKLWASLSLWRANWCVRYSGNSSKSRNKRFFCTSLLGSNLLSSHINRAAATNDRTSVAHASSFRSIRAKSWPPCVGSRSTATVEGVASRTAKASAQPLAFSKDDSLSSWAQTNLGTNVALKCLKVRWTDIIQFYIITKYVSFFPFICLLHPFTTLSWICPTESLRSFHVSTPTRVLLAPGNITGPKNLHTGAGEDGAKRMLAAAMAPSPTFIGITASPWMIMDGYGTRHKVWTKICIVFKYPARSKERLTRPPSPRNLPFWPLHALAATSTARFAPGPLPQRRHKSLLQNFITACTTSWGSKACVTQLRHGKRQGEKNKLEGFIIPSLL